MKTLHSLNEYPSQTPACVTVGFFDGVHSGHTYILNELVLKAKEYGACSVVITFWPHPKQILKPDEPYSLLTTLEEKIQLLRKQHIDYVIILPFTIEFSKQGTEQFLRSINTAIRVETMLFGFDQTMGNNRSDKYPQISAYAKKLGLPVQQITEFSVENQNPSSTRIKKYIADGDLVVAHRLLGYKYSITGSVDETMTFKPLSEFKILPESGNYNVLVPLFETEFILKTPEQRLFGQKFVNELVTITFNE